MAMAEILDSVRRIVFKWVNTASRIQADLFIGDTVVSVSDARRFSPGDQVMLRKGGAGGVYETGLIIDEVDRATNSVTLSTGTLNDWTMAEDTIFVKTIEEQFVQGIYIGDPDVIPRYPAITVNGVSRTSEWLTLESTKERYQVELTIYVQASAHEKGYRFLMAMADEVQKGLKRNLFPLVGDYNITSLVDDVSRGDVNIKVNQRDEMIKYPRRIIIEDDFSTHENWISYIHKESEDPAKQSIRLVDCVPFNFLAGDTSIIIPDRFIFNSWPDSVQYGSIHKGELLKAAKISWFAEEEEIQGMGRQEPKLR
jgi:hypothetical protein